MEKFTKRILLTSGVLALGLAVAAPNKLADKVAIDPMFTYGETLDDSQYTETKELLGVEDGVTEIEVAVNELNDLLQDSYPYNQVYSSAYITPADNDGGVTVEIETPDTITDITEAQYENAAITAGAVDVDIKVASAVTVDGSGALAGVYKAFEDAGYSLDDDARQVAQDELAVTSSITQENEDTEGYSDSDMNAAIADIKAQVADLKEQNGGSISVDEITVIVNNVVNNYNLNGVISEDNIQAIINQMKNFSNLELSEEQKTQLSNLASSLTDAASNVAASASSAIENADTEQLQEDAIGIWDRILSIIDNIFGTSFSDNKENNNE